MNEGQDELANEANADIRSPLNTLSIRFRAPFLPTRLWARIALCFALMVAVGCRSFRLMTLFRFWWMKPSTCAGQK
jgi:hypothetical protein